VVLLSPLRRWLGWLSARRHRAPVGPEDPRRDAAEALRTGDAYHLIERRTIEDVEREHTCRPEDLSVADRRSPQRAAARLKPFGHANGQWVDLKAAMRPGDELWTFASSLESWQALAGCAGIALVRDGKIVATMITMVN
jgi:hypothetical protein